MSVHSSPGNRGRLDAVSVLLYYILFYVLGLGLCVQADLCAQF